MQPFANRRILVIDDESSIHADYRSILTLREENTKLAEMEASLFGEAPARSRVDFELSSAHQGREGVELAQKAMEDGAPFSVAFVDMRMPPGWNGLRTVEELWKVDPRLQVVMCTAYSEHSWDTVLRELDARDRLLVVKKPFDPVEVYQAAATLSAKWSLARQAETRIEWLEQAIAQRTAALQKANEELSLQLELRDQMMAELAQARSGPTSVPN